MTKSKKAPPKPRENRSPYGIGGEPDAQIDDPVGEQPDNVNQVGDRANIRQNTSNVQDKR